MVLQLFYTQKLKKKKLFNLYGKKPQKGYPFLIYVAIFHSINSVVLTLTSHFKPPMVKVAGFLYESAHTHYLKAVENI